VPKLPEPPPAADLAAIRPDVRVLPTGTTIWRVYFQAGAHPTTWGQLRSWGPTNARFDHQTPPPSLQTRRILYGAIGPKAAVTALAEVFQAARVVDRVAGAPTWVAFSTSRELRLLDLSGTWPTRAGASMALASGPRPRARRWSRAIHDAYPDVEGLLYPSSMHANERSVALYERAATAIPGRPIFHRLLSDPAVLTLLKRACQEVGYALV
jgi:hypothetical protein